MAAGRRQLFEARIRVTAKNTRGVLAQMAAAIAESGSEHRKRQHGREDAGAFYTTLQFHAAGQQPHPSGQVMRSLRHVQQEWSVARARGE